MLLEQHLDERDKPTYLAQGSWLHVAAFKGWDDGVRALAEAGFSLNFEDREHHYPVRLAAENGHLSTVETLIDLGCNLVSAPSSTNLLFAAAIGRSPEITEVFLKRGVDPLALYKGNERSLNAISFAYYIGSDSVAETLARFVTGIDESKFVHLIEQEKKRAGRHELDSNS